MRSRFATHGRPIPSLTTTIGDEFDGDIPGGGFTLLGGEEIGQILVETLREGSSSDCLLKSHGVLTAGPTSEKVVKAAVMIENNAAISLGFTGSGQSFADYAGRY